MAHQSSRGNARRSLALLWGRAEPGARGPKSGFDVATIVREAVLLADREGIDGFSMRQLGDALGCSVMSLYTYVHGKAELLDLMLDTVLGELAAVPKRGRFRQRVEAAARRLYAHHLDHPWVLQVNSARALLGPNELAHIERQLSLFDGQSLTGADMMHCVSSLGSFVRGAARAVVDARAAHRATGVSDKAWWAERSAALEEMAPDLAARFPLIARLDQERAFDLVDGQNDDEPYTVQDAMLVFEFGLARLLDGFESFLASKAARPKRRSAVHRDPE
jgi:AcrR family transcriptional regulator